MTPSHTEEVIVAGYAIAQQRRMLDPQAFGEYAQQVGLVIERYGGRFLVRGGTVHAKEGDWSPRLVVIEFPSVERAQEWYDSEEYRPLRELRQRAAEGDLIIVEGA